MKKTRFVLTLFLLYIAASQNAWAKTADQGIELSRLGVAAGLVDPESVGGTLGFTAFADLGTLAPDVRLTTHMGYWSRSENDFGAEASLRDISVGARALYMFHMSSPKVRPYAGAGLGLHFFHTKVQVPDMNLGGGFIIPGFTAEDSAAKVGLDLGGGASTPLSPKTDLFADFWYTLADIDQVSLKAGVSFLLSR